MTVFFSLLIGLRPLRSNFVIFLNRFRIFRWTYNVYAAQVVVETRTIFFFVRSVYAHYQLTTLDVLLLLLVRCCRRIDSAVVLHQRYRNVYQQSHTDYTYNINGTAICKQRYWKFNCRHFECDSSDCWNFRFTIDKMYFSDSLIVCHTNTKCGIRRIRIKRHHTVISQLKFAQVSATFCSPSLSLVTQRIWRRSITHTSTHAPSAFEWQFFVYFVCRTDGDVRYTFVTTRWKPYMCVVAFIRLSLALTLTLLGWFINKYETNIFICYYLLLTARHAYTNCHESSWLLASWIPDNSLLPSAICV